MRSRKLNRDKVLASLNTPCTLCGYEIPPEEMSRSGFSMVRCPKCGKDFEPGKKVEPRAR